LPLSAVLGGASGYGYQDNRITEKQGFAKESNKGGWVRRRKLNLT
jgi:hypothetical protein